MFHGLGIVCPFDRDADLGFAPSDLGLVTSPHHPPFPFLSHIRIRVNLRQIPAVEHH